MADPEKLSKFLAYALRHQPEKFDLTLDEQGFAPTDAVWAAISKQFGGRYQLSDLLAVVAGDKTGKKRYEIDGRYIRALYGHNAAVAEVIYQPAVPPALLYHGTNEAAVRIIREEGLRALGRQYVHLTTSLARATIVAQRRSAMIVMLEVLALEAHNAGTAFYHPEDEHYLVKAVPAAFIRFS
jgi:putative RNA 2'-phosphotransferase